MLQNLVLTTNNWTVIQEMLNRFVYLQKLVNWCLTIRPLCYGSNDHLLEQKHCTCHMHQKQS